MAQESRLCFVPKDKISSTLQNRASVQFGSRTNESMTQVLA